MLSVVITTYTLQRLKDVQELLESLKAQTYPTLEILFVGESLELCDQVKAYGEQRGVANLRVLFNDGTPGLSPARNLGARRARGEVIAFVDDDAVASPEWAEEMVKVMVEHPSAIGVAGAAVPLWEDGAMKWFPEEFYWLISCPVPAWTGVSEVKPVRNAWGVNMAFRREAFEACQFSESFGVSNQGAAEGIKLALQADDTEFCVRLYQATKRPILFNPYGKVFHKVRGYRLSPRFTRHMAFWDGYAKATLGKLFRNSGTGGEKFRLSNEFTLLRRLAFPFFPRLLGGFLVNPIVAWRRLALALDVLFHAFLGYVSGCFPGPGRHIARRYSR